MLLLLAVPVSWPVRLMIWTLIGASLYRSLRIYMWRQGSTAIETLEMNGEGVVSVRFAGKGAWHVCQITSRFVHPWLTLLSLKIESQHWPISLAIAADAVDSEAFRRWRVALKFHKVPA